MVVDAPIGEAIEGQFAHCSVHGELSFVAYPNARAFTVGLTVSL